MPNIVESIFTYLQVKLYAFTGDGDGISTGFMFYYVYARSGGRGRLQWQGRLRFNQARDFCSQSVPVCDA